MNLSKLQKYLVFKYLFLSRMYFKGQFLKKVSVAFVEQLDSDNKATVKWRLFTFKNTKLLWNFG